MRRSAIQAFAAQAYGTGVDVVDAGATGQQRGLARAVGADERYQFPGIQMQIDIVQSVDGAVARTHA
jgi:hypothetical protein